MDFFGTVVLVIIAMLIAGNLHPQGVGMVLVLLIAAPLIVGGLKLLKDGQLGALLGLLLVVPAVALVVWFFSSF